MNAPAGPLPLCRRAARHQRAALLLAAWLGASSAHAQEPATVPVNMGFVDMSRLLEQSPQMGEWRTRLQAEFAERTRELQAEAASIEELKRKSADTQLPQAERDTLERRIAAADRALKRARAEFDNLQTVRRGEALDAMDKLIGEAAAAAARERGFSAVLTRENAVYIDPALDLTESVLTRLKKAGPASTPP